MHFMAKSPLFSFAIAILSQTSLSLALTTPGQDLKLTFTDTALNNATMPYNLFLPQNYSSTTSSNLPVIIFLHGSGECGTDNNKQVDSWFPPIVSETQSSTSKHRAIVIAPQCAVGKSWSGNTLQEVMDILKYVETTQKVNTNKVYITGISLGGIGTWTALSQFPNTFAAGMPLSGWGNTSTALSLVNEPIWAFHGLADNTVSSTGTTSIINAIRNDHGTKAIETLVPGLDHGSGWDTFYTNGAYKIGDAYTSGGSPNGTGLYDWMFAQSLNIPEPTSLSLLASAGLLLLRRRK